MLNHVTDNSSAAAVTRSLAQCRKARVGLSIIVVLCAFAQIIIDSSLENLECVFISLAFSIATMQFTIRSSVIRHHPLSCLMAVGFNIATMSGALVAQTLNWTPLIFNLQIPQTTFLSCGLFQVSILAALIITTNSRTLRKTSTSINASFWLRIGIMGPPTTLQLWLMGFIGLTALASMIALTSTEITATSGSGGKILQGLYYLAFAPFLIPLMPAAFPATSKTRSRGRSGLPLGIYFFFLVIIAVARNSRGTFATGIANFGMTGALLYLVGQLQISKKNRNWLMAAAITVLVAAPTLSDLAVSMVVVRGMRTHLSGTELVEKTYSAFQDKEMLENYRKATRLLKDDQTYEETYINNPFVARFISIKFVDNSLSYSGFSKSPNSSYILDTTLDRIIALLPTPIINLFDSSFSKENLNFSIGDALYYSAAGSGLGSYKTGSPIGHGMALFGPLIFILVIPLLILTFISLDSLSHIRNGYVIISPVVLLQLMGVYYLGSGDSLLDLVSLMLRVLPQNILIYWIIFHFTRRLTSSRKQRRLVDASSAPSAAGKAEAGRRW